MDLDDVRPCQAGFDAACGGIASRHRSGSTKRTEAAGPPGAERTSNNSRKIEVFDGFSENCFELGTAAPFDEAFDAILDTDRASEFVELLP